MQPPDKPEVVLHIGGAKCGSSAIQAYLSQNESALAAKGIGVPGLDLDFKSEVTGEQIWFFERSAADGGASIGEKLAKLLDVAGAKGLNKIVVSAENLCNHPALAKRFADALQSVSTKVVFYVRRQDDFLISSWQQWNLKRFASLEAFLEARLPRDARWFNMVSPWAHAFGDAQICVRPFRRNVLFNGDVVEDFFKVIDVPQDGLVPLKRNANPSFDEALARLAHRVRDLFDTPHDNRFYDVMARLLGEDALKTSKASSLMDLETRQRICEAHSRENEELRKRFLPDFPHPLFESPTGNDVRVLTDAEKLSEEMAMLTRSVYALASRMEGSNA